MITIIITFFFFMVIKLRPFKHPLDPDDYFNKDGEIKDEMVTKDLDLTDKKLV